MPGPQEALQVVGGCMGVGCGGSCLKEEQEKNRLRSLFVSPCYPFLCSDSRGNWGG